MTEPVRPEKVEPQGNQRFRKDNMKFTVDGLKKLKNDLEKNEPTNELTPIASGTVATGQALEVVGKMPPTMSAKAEPKKSWAAARPPSATL